MELRDDERRLWELLRKIKHGEARLFIKAGLLVRVEVLESHLLNEPVGKKS